MDLTPQNLWSLRNIVVRAVNECHEILADSARRAKAERSKATPAPELKLKERVGFKRAAVAVARKVSVVMHAMLKSGERFDQSASLTV